MSDANVIALDVTNSAEVWLGGQRLCARSGMPQQSAARKLREMRIPECVIHFRRLGHVVRAVALSKLLEEADA